MILLTEKFDLGENFRLALIVGFLGALTTFSTFETELYELSRGRELFIALPIFF